MRIRERFNPRAPCGARPVLLYGIYTLLISTHAPLAGRDASGPPPEILRRISTHAPLAGRDDLTADLARAVEYFNPRAPCGARRCCWWA